MEVLAAEGWSLKKGVKLAQGTMCQPFLVRMPALLGHQKCVYSQAYDSLAEVCSEQHITLRDAALNADLRKVCP